MGVELVSANYITGSISTVLDKTLLCLTDKKAFDIRGKKYERITLNESNKNPDLNTT